MKLSRNWKHLSVMAEANKENCHHTGPRRNGQWRFQALQRHFFLLLCHFLDLISSNWIRGRNVSDWQEPHLKVCISFNFAVHSSNQAHGVLLSVRQWPRSPDVWTMVWGTSPRRGVYKIHQGRLLGKIIRIRSRGYRDIWHVLGNTFNQDLSSLSRHSAQHVYLLPWYFTFNSIIF